MSKTTEVPQQLISALTWSRFSDRSSPLSRTRVRNRSILRVMIDGSRLRQFAEQSGCRWEGFERKQITLYRSPDFSGNPEIRGAIRRLGAIRSNRLRVFESK